MMKIALVNKKFSLTHGGLERFSVNLAAALSREGHSVCAVGLEAEDLPQIVDFVRVQPKKHLSFLQVIAAARAFQAALVDQRCDIVYALTRILQADMVRLGDGVHRHWMRIRYPMAVERWLNYLVNPAHLANLFLETRLYRGGHFRRIVTNSRLCKEQVQCYYGVAPALVEVIYNGVDHRVFSPKAVQPFRTEVRRKFGLSDGEILLLHVSNNWKRKGLEVILQAVASLCAKGHHVHVLVVGRGPEKQFVQKAQALGIGSQLHIAGPTREVQRYYGAADLFVLPTMYDPFSNVCLEAMACGLPVITTAENGAAELVREGKNGYVQKNPQNAEELADLLLPCIDRGHREAMGRVALQTALPFTPERNMKQTLQLCARVLEEKGR